jgi:hypothetical protein
VLARLTLAPPDIRDRWAWLGVVVWTSISIGYLVLVVTGMEGRANVSWNDTMLCLDIPYQLQPALLVGGWLSWRRARKLGRTPTLSGVVGWGALFAVAMVPAWIAAMWIATSLNPLSYLIWPLTLIYELVVIPASIVVSVIGCIELAGRWRTAPEPGSAT